MCSTWNGWRGSVNGRSNGGQSMFGALTSVRSRRRRGIPLTLPPARKRCSNRARNRLSTICSWVSSMGRSANSSRARPSGTTPATIGPSGVCTSDSRTTPSSARRRAGRRRRPRRATRRAPRSARGESPTTGRQRRHGRYPANSASAEDAKRSVFLALGAGAGHPSRQKIPVVRTARTDTINPSSGN